MAGSINQIELAGGSSVHRPDIAATFRDVNLVVSECRSRKWEVDMNEIKYFEELGNGSNGVVFKAEYRGQVCVVKRAIPFWTALEAKNANKDMVAELDVLMSVGKHPNVVEMIGASTANPDKIVVIEEYVAGPSLEQYFREKWISNGPGKTPKWRRGYLWILGMMQALEFLHERDPVIMHRDLKPANLLLAKDLSTLKLCDFGMSKKVDRRTKDRTVHSGRMGTQRFMAPEVRAERHGRYNEKADVFSAGQVMWLILKGRHPQAVTGDGGDGNGAVTAGSRTSSVSRASSESEGAAGGVERHPLDPPVRLVELMERCRLRESAARPSAREGVEQLRGMAASIPNGCCAVQ